ncbi:hypothetical protein FWH30_02725, partial [Microgenomates group bacterium]|nr:hypothetical protein [Microgenomates group bacterium]
PVQEALYIVDKDVGKNELVAGGKARTKVRAIEIDDFMVAGPVVAPPPKKLFALAANSFWGSPSASHPLLSSPIYLRIRHLGEFYPVEIEKRGQSLIVTALEGEFEGVAPGQFGVFYGEKDADGRRECLGSGKIKKRCV